MATLFSLIEKPSNYVFEDNKTAQWPWGKVCKSGNMSIFTPTISYWEVCRHFSGRGEHFLKEGFSIIFWGKEILIFPREIYTWGICQVSYTKFFLFVLFSICQLSFKCGDIEWNCSGQIFTGLKSSRVSFLRWGGDFQREKFSMLEFTIGWILQREFSTGAPF